MEVKPVLGDRGVFVDSAISVMVGNESLYGNYGGGALTAYDSAEDYEDFRRAVNRALATSRQETFEVRVELRIR